MKDQRIEPMHTRRAAFTLVELSIVIVIIALISAMGMVSGVKLIESTRVASTEKKLDEIERALATFYSLHDRMPCAANPNLPGGDAVLGREELLLSGVQYYCAYSSGGALPVRELGLSSEYMLDGWGRRFFYYPDYTPFPIHHLTSPESLYSLLTVNDVNGAARSQRPAYVLLSHGTNGYGAYIDNGTQPADLLALATGSEAQNLPGSSAFVQRPVGPQYDDILRYKEAWQLSRREDDLAKGYYGPQFIVGGYSSSLILQGVRRAPNTFDLSNNIWGSLAVGDAGASVAGSVIKFIKFLPNNTHVFVYSSNATTCHLLKLAGHKYVNLWPTAVPAAACPAYNASNVVAMSENGYLAIASGGTVTLSRHAGDTFTSLGTVSPGFTPISVTLTKNADFMLMTSSTTNVKMYRRKYDGSGFDPITLGSGAPPTGISGNISYSAISPDGRFVIMTSTSSPPRVYVWEFHPDYSFTLYTNTALTSGSTTTPIAFSGNDRFVAVGYGTSMQQYPPIMYRILQNGTVQTLDNMVGANNFGGTARDFSFSSDGRRMIATYYNGVYYIRDYLQQNPTSYQASGALIYSASVFTSATAY